MDAPGLIDASEWVQILNAVNRIEESPEQFKLKDDFGNTMVEELLEQAAQKFGLNVANIYLMCYGRILDKQNSLESYGIKNGTLMILRKKNHPELATPMEEPRDDPILPSATIAQKSALFRRTFKDLKLMIGKSPKTNEIKESMLAKYSEFTQDPTLYAIFTDTVMLCSLLETKQVKTTLKRYPRFLEYTEHYLELWKTELRATFKPDVVSNLNLLLSSDDEDSDGGQRQGRRPGFQEIQAAARRLANMVRGNNPREASAASSSADTSEQQHQITAEMLRNALEPTMPRTPECAPLQLEQSSSSRATASSSSSSSVHEPITLAEQLSRANSAPQTPSGTQNAPERSQQVQTLIDRLPQLQTMRELGITDEIVAIQALEAANGDLQAAINIIFSEDN